MIDQLGSDPGELSGRVSGATARLADSVSKLDEELAHGPSLLPGWSRGHVLTHIARNADGLRNLLVWARTGIETPMYPSAQARNDQINAGAGRTAAALSDDVAASAAGLAAEAGRLSPQNWQVSVRDVHGREFPAWYALWRRLSEVEIHHVDLDAGYGPADWPPAFVAECLPRLAGEFARNPEAPAALLRDTGTGREYRIAGPEPGAPVITGPGCELLAWLLGRNQGASLAIDPAGPLPPVPAW